MAILLGGAAFSGSMLAWSKLSGILKMGPGPGIGYRSGGLFLLVAGLALCGVLVPYPEYYSAALALAAVALALGVAAVAPIHKPEMQAVVLLMGAFSGFAAAGVGFAMASEVVVVGGGLVGAATLGQCLALCREKKRSLWRVLRGR
jgi:NAD(P) transhydrogenase subunit beta